MQLEYLLVGLFAFVLTLAMSFLALKLFPKLGLMDRPHKYGLKRAPIPYYGGLVIFLSFLIAVLCFVPLTKSLIGVLVAGGLLVLVSFLDDKYSLSPFLRLGVQIAVAVIVVLTGIGIHSLSNPFGAVISLDALVWHWQIGEMMVAISVWSALFTVIWLVLLINSMNFADGLNGLSSGVTAIAAFFLFVLSIRPNFHHVNQSTFAMLALILFAVALAFVFFDFYPAKMLMGDTGSTFLGFMLAVLAIFSGGKVATVFLIMGVPILDAFWVIGRRLYNGKWPWQGDLLHLHHRLKDTGFSERQVVLLLYLLTFLFGLLALLAGTWQKLIVASLLFGFMFVLGVYLTFRRRV